MRIAGVELLWAQIPLREPYILSFVTVESVDSVVVRLTLDDGSIGYGEAVPLPGYSSETRESLFRDLRAIMADLPGLAPGELQAYLIERIPHSPFAISALVTAKEMATAEIAFPAAISLPLLAPVSAGSDSAAVLEKSLAYYQEGYRTIKLKVGRDIDDDRAAVRTLLAGLPDDCRLRIDANQAYREEEADQLLWSLDHPRAAILELVEQPFGIDRWDAFELLARRHPSIPLMLDESILDDSDVVRAAEIGATFVKLKLFKHPGLSGLLNLATRAKGLGLKVVLGNGVSTDIGNMIEAVGFQASGLFSGASEANGFEKLVYPALVDAPRVERGNMVWQRNVDTPVAEMIRDHIYKVVAKEGGK